MKPNKVSEEKLPHDAPLAMLILLDSVEEGRERVQTTEALLQLVWRLWQWNPERFKQELDLARGSLGGK